MRLTLKNLRLDKGWSLELASKIYGIKAKTLNAYETYKQVPSSQEVITILKILKMNYDEVFYVIYEDIARHYKRPE